MTMTNPGTRKKTVAKVTSQTISPALLGQTKVQIWISCLQRVEKKINIASFIIFTKKFSLSPSVSTEKKAAD